jgi:hypothetical protein
MSSEIVVAIIILILCVAGIAWLQKQSKHGTAEKEREAAGGGQGGNAPASENRSPRA